MSITLANSNAQKANYENAVLLYNVATGQTRQAIIATTIVKPTRAKLKSVEKRK